MKILPTKDNLALTKNLVSCYLYWVGMHQCPKCRDEDQSVHLKAWKWFHPPSIVITILQAIEVCNTIFLVKAL